MNYNQLAEQKLHNIIEKAQENSVNANASIQNMQPRDYLVDTSRVNFFNEDGKFKMGNNTKWPIHSHALGQMSQKFGIPTRYTNALLQEDEDWAIDLLVDNFTKLRDHRNSGKTYLVRTVNKEIRGFLSNKYKIIDSGLLLESFAKGVSAHGGIIETFHSSDTKWYINAIIPKIYNPLGQDPVAFGITLANSDFGNGKMQLTAYILRLLCTNGLVGKDAFSRTHLGKRMNLSDFSSKTRLLESKAIASGVSDIVNTTVSEDALEAQVACIKEAAEDELNPSEALKSYRQKAKISKDEEEELRNICVSGDLEELPPGNNRWRMSQSLSLLAKKKDDADRAHELKQLGGKLLEEGKI